MSWAPEVIADSSGQWCGNALRFATKAEAEANVRDLFGRWTAVKETRVVESDEPANFKWTRNGLEKLQPENDCACGGTGVVPDPHTEDGYAPCPDCVERFAHKVDENENCVYCGLVAPAGVCPAANHPNRKTCPSGQVA